MQAFLIVCNTFNSPSPTATLNSQTLQCWSKGLKQSLHWSKNCSLYLSLPQDQLWGANMGRENSIIGTNMHVDMLKAFTEILLCSLKKYMELFGSLLYEVEHTSTYHSTASVLPRCIQQTRRTICHFSSFCTLTALITFV